MLAFNRPRHLLARINLRTTVRKDMFVVPVGRSDINVFGIARLWYIQLHQSRLSYQYSISITSIIDRLAEFCAAWHEAC